MAKAPLAQHSGGTGNVLYYEIASFLNGIDVRKNVMTAPAGTLRTLSNCHITPGGEIEKRSQFEYAGTITPSSGSLVAGLVSLNNIVYVVIALSGYTGLVPPSGGASFGIAYVTPPSGIALTEMRAWDVYNGKFFMTFLGWTGSGYGCYSYYDCVYVPGADGRALACRTYKEKMYGINGRYLYFSAVGDPTTWVDPPPDPVTGAVAHNGSGYISIGSNDSDSENLVAMEVYYDKMAIFSTLGCQLWFLDPDPSLNQYYQTLRDAGTIARNSARQYVANDVYFLGAHGIRSLRARDLTTTAAVADVGSPLDPMIQGLVASRGFSGSTADDMGSMQSALATRTGRLWMSAGDTIFVLSNYSSPNIAAWSTYLPGFIIHQRGMVAADPFMYLMDVDYNIYRYGSYTTLNYDSCPVEIITPALSFDKPVTNKFFQGFDAIANCDASSLWNVQMCFDPTQAGPPWDQICTLNAPTTLGGSIPISGQGTHVQLRITHQAPGAATFSKLMIHYAPSDTD